MKISKKAYIILGFISLFIGLLFGLLPILPTSPFLLISGICFSKGSFKFNQKVKATKAYKFYAKYLQKYVRRYKFYAHKIGFTLLTKLLIVLVATFVMAGVFLIFDIHIFFAIMTFCLWISFSCYVLFTLKTKK